MSNTIIRRRLAQIRKRFPGYDRTYANTVNCDYCEEIFNSKDCYMVFNSAEMEDCLYVIDGYKEVNDIDCDNGVMSERCYESTDFARCTDCDHVQHCVRCYNVSHSYMLSDCHDCYLCANLANKSYCIENIQYTEEEYKDRLRRLNKLPKEKIQQKLKNLSKKFPRINLYYDEATNSDFADYVFFVKNLYYSFDCSNSQDLGYTELSHFTCDTWDSIYALRCEGCVGALFSSECYGSYEVYKCSRCYDSFFLENCHDCHDCFACVNLENKKYCIFNIQYTKEEYKKRLKKVKKELNIYFQQK